MSAYASLFRFCGPAVVQLWEKLEGATGSV